MEGYQENNNIDCKSKDFTAGFALALAEMLRNGAEASNEGEATVGSAGISLEEFATAGVAEFDYDTIHEHRKALWPGEFDDDDVEEDDDQQ